MFFGLADDDDKGYINEDKLFSLFKKNLRSDEDLKTLKVAGKIRRGICLFKQSHSKSFDR